MDKLTPVDNPSTMRRNAPITTEELNAYIKQFREDHGSDPVEHVRVIRNGTIIYEGTCGKTGSCDHGGDLRNADVLHNHPHNSPAFSENDVILAVYGNSRSSTAVTKNRGSWSLIRPESGWGLNPNTFHKNLSKDYKNSLNRSKKSDSTQELIRKVRAKEISMEEGDGLFNEEYSEKAIAKSGLRIYKSDAVVSFEGIIALTAIFGGALAVVALLSVLSPKKN
jgi:hypothetical protein